MATRKKPLAAAKPPALANKEKTDYVAKVTILPCVNAAAVVEEYAKAFGEQDIGALVDELRTKFDQVNEGNLQHCETMLVGQAQALQSIFVNLSRRAVNQEYLKQFETYLRLALKAQNQSRMTLETLAAIKNPPVVFARQANIAHGHQQVNNGNTLTSTPAPAHTGKTEKGQTKLLTEDNHATLDTSGTAAASGANQELETVGAIHRP